MACSAGQQKYLLPEKWFGGKRFRHPTDKAYKHDIMGDYPESQPTLAIPALRTNNVASETEKPHHSCVENI